jgi:hypothetical protein
MNLKKSKVIFWPHYNADITNMPINRAEKSSYATLMRKEKYHGKTGLSAK